LILFADDLEKVYKIPKTELVEQKKSAKLYEFLNQKRLDYFAEISANRKGIIARSLDLHNQSIEYQKEFKSKTLPKNTMIKYLEQINPGIKAKSRLMCISDATGSMKSVWLKAKGHIREMVQRINKIGGEGISELMWVGYRDYCDKNILEYSNWTSNSDELLKFVEKIKCTGGGGDGPEAVEVALKFANETEGVTRIILIGDAEPHLEGKGNMMPFFKKVLETDYEVESRILAAKGIPVYTFYMYEEAPLKDSFTNIAAITGGKACPFGDVNTLIDVISENVLDDIGGEDLVLEYRKTYHS